MRGALRHWLARMLGALALSGVIALVLWWAGQVALLVAVFALLAVLMFALLTIAPDAIAHWRGHRWRWWWRASDDDGPFWSGTRIPRHPYPPRMPPRRAAVER